MDDINLTPDVEIEGNPEPLIITSEEIITDDINENLSEH